jgi:ribosomal protein L37E
MSVTRVTIVTCARCGESRSYDDNRRTQIACEWVWHWQSRVTIWHGERPMPSIVCEQCITDAERAKLVEFGVYGPPPGFLGKFETLSVYRCERCGAEEKGTHADVPEGWALEFEAILAPLRLELVPLAAAPSLHVCDGCLTAEERERADRLAQELAGRDDAIPF